MIEIAEKFKAIGESGQKRSSASSIFGDTNLSKSITVETNRFGFYPLISQKPDIAMGIASCLAYLVEQYNNVKVYRIFAKFDADNVESEITESDYQFAPDQWEFAGLDDNITISGHCQFMESSINLKLIVEVDSIQGSRVAELIFDYKHLSDLVGELPAIAKQIIEEIRDTSPEELIITYDIDSISDDLSFESALENVFYWNLDLYLHLWGVEWPDEDILDQFNEMITLSQSLGHEFVVWCTTMMAKQVMQLGLEVVGDVIVPRLNPLIQVDKSANIAAAGLSMSLATLGYVDQAINTVNNAKQSGSINLNTWFAIINVYLKANQLQKAINANQEAIENGLKDYRMYWMYYQLLNIAESNDFFVDELLLIDPDEIREDEQISYEIIESLKIALETTPNNQIILQSLLKYMTAVEHTELWKYFADILHSQAPYLIMRGIIENFYDLYDLSPAFDILEKYKEEHVDEPEAILYLAQLELIDGQLDDAQQLLEQVRLSIDDAALKTELQRFLLLTSIDGFESKYADILIMLDANKNISESDVDLLESAVEIAPEFADIYVTLARCYIQWNDYEAVREVLKDATDTIGYHPRISQIGASLDWRTGNKESAMAKLNDALQESPNDVQLLSQTAQFLIENRQFEDSKQYIERLEVIAPSHPEVWKLRKLITDSLNS